MDSNAFIFIKSMASIIGFVLIVIGASLLLYLAYFIYQIMHEPQVIPIIDFVMEKIKIDNNAFQMTMTITQEGLPPQNTEFDLKWSDSMQFVVFSIVMVIVFSVMASIAGSLINSGVNLIKVAGSHDGKVKD